MDILNKSDNSLIIVTTRDVGVVINAGITVGYPLKGMDGNHGWELFCWHAFDQPLPQSGYEGLVDQFVDVCRGLPLSLQVLGRLVRGRPHEYWELTLLKTREMLPQDVKQSLRISFDALEDEEKQVFMDIACFFVGQKERMAERILEGSGWNAKNALQTLKDKCLIEGIDIMFGGIALRMHDHLRDLGREMALELSSPKPLWHPRDLESLQFTGLKTILAKTNVRHLHTIFDKSMKCQVTFFLGQSDSCVETSASLLWLKLDRIGIFLGGTKQTGLPSWIPLQNLQCLEVSNLRCKRLFENRMQISHYRHQISCRDLQRVSGSGDPIQLRDLIISVCPELQELPSLSRVKCMEKIKILSCDKLQNIMLPPTLISLCLRSCRDLKRVSGSGELIKLRDLTINHCPEVKELPSLFRLSCMKKIEIGYCDKLQNIMLPPPLISLSLRSCRDLQRVSGSGELIKLRDLIVLKLRSCQVFPE